MKDLEEVNCEIRRVVDIQSSVLSRLKDTDDDEHGRSKLPEDDYKPQGGFLNGTKYVWMSNGTRLVVFNARSGENISSWRFCDKIGCVAQFPAKVGQLPLLLVGLDNDANKVKDSVGMLCIFDCTTSRVLRAIRMPAGVEQVCVISGGADWEEFNDKRPDDILNKADGMACVVLCNLYHLMIDLRRSLWDASNMYPLIDEALPAEIDISPAIHPLSISDSTCANHAAYNLLNSRIERHLGFSREEFEMSTLFEEKLTSVVISSIKIGCLISGCLGRVIIWQNDGSVGWISPLLDGNMAVSHLALLEPTDDPRPYCYLWVVYQSETLKMSPLLRMYALLFERKYYDKGTNIYFNLEAEPSLKFEFELDEGDKIINLSAIERETNPEQTDSVNKRGEDNLLLIATSKETLLFDLNQWYKEQMPRTITECQNLSSIMASYRTRSTEQGIISSSYIPDTLTEFPNNNPNSSEELFYPNSLSLEWIDLNSNCLTFCLTRGIQADLLREMALAGPVILIEPSQTFHKCLSVGLIPFNTEVSFDCDQNSQREMLLSLCLEQRWATFLVKCMREWSDGSASYLYPTFLKWGVQRASSIKIIADRLCIPLFDQSGSSIGETEIKTLRFCSQQLECLSNVVAKLPIKSDDFMKQQKALKRISTYFQVLLWFYDVGLLPETQEIDEGALPISLTLKVPYPVERLTALYTGKREQLRCSKDDKEEGLFIDELISRECLILRSQWERESGDTSTAGYYPPPSLQSLLRSYLTDCNRTEFNEIECKHQVTIYLLMDLAMLLQGSYPSVDQLIKYPSAFKMSPSLIRLTQAFWLLDHEDYQGFLEMMTGQLVSDSDVKDWHHRLVLRQLVRNSQHKLALVYLRVRKPPLSSIEDQRTIISLSVEHGLVQSAFHRRPPSHYSQLLISFFQACKAYGKLSEILHLTLDAEEEEVFVKFLENEKSGDVRLLYYLQRCRYTEAYNGNLFGQYKSSFLKNMQPASLAMLDACNATLPEVTKRFTLNSNKSNVETDIDSRYPRPLSHRKSTKKSLGIYETVVRKARETYLRGERPQIPFVTAPCTSLKPNNNMNMNCVLFPSLTQKNRSKRTLDQMRENEDNDTPDTSKRRKLSDTNDSLNRSNMKDLGLNSVLETPLVKRKSSVTNGRDAPPETPHSILKIRQLIRNSTSPSVTILTSENTETSSCEREKKITRQIRFNVEQSKQNSLQDDGNNEEEEYTSKSTSVSKSNGSEESEDVFYSPNISNKSCSESTVLSDSSFSTKNTYCPRPRPSLRHSYIKSSKEALNTLHESPTSTPTRESFGNASTNTSLTSSPNEYTNASLTSIDTKQTSSNVSPRALKDQNSLPSTSIHSSTILSSDTSFETYVPQARSGISPRSRFRQEQSYTPKQEWVDDYKRTVSSTPLVRNTTVSEANGNFLMEVDNSALTDSEPSTATSKGEKLMSRSAFTATTDKLDNTFKTQQTTNRSQQFIKYSSKTESGSNFETSMMDINKREISSMQEDIQEETLSDEYERREKTVDSPMDQGELSEEESSHREKFEDYKRAGEQSEDENVENASLTDESEEELLRLSDVEDDDIEDDAFKSLSNSIQSSRDRSSATPTSKVTNCQQKTNRSSLKNSTNVLTSSVHMFDITDDESSNDVQTIPSGESDAANENVASITHTKSALDDREMLNITDDESDNSLLVDTEKTKSVVPGHVQVDNAERKSTKPDRKIFEKGMRMKPVLDENVKISMQFDVKNKVITEDTTTGTAIKNSVSAKIIETDNTTPVRRSRRTSSAAKDTTIASPSEVPFVSSVDKRTRRASSLAKDVDTPLNVMEKSSNLRNASDPSTAINVTPPKRNQTHRSNAVANDLPQDEDISEDNIGTPLRRSSRRLSSIQRDLPEMTKPNSASVEKEKPSTPKKLTRGRRSSSVAKEYPGVPNTLNEHVPAAEVINMETNVSETRTTRKRASSVPKETVVRTGRMRRSNSVINDVIPEETSESLVGTSRGKRASKAAVEISRIVDDVIAEQPIEPTVQTKRGRKTIKAVETEEKNIRNDESEEIFEPSLQSKRGKKTNKTTEETNVTSKKVIVEKTPDLVVKSRRGRKPSKSVEDVTPEKLEEVAVKSNKGRKTSKSIKETGTIVEDIPQENTEVLTQTRRGRKPIVSKITENVPSSPAGNTRSRRSSIQSVPEELEEILSVPTVKRGTKATAQSVRRARRATSVDLPTIEVTNRIRNRRATSITKDPIIEDPAEHEDEDAPKFVNEKRSARRKNAPINDAAHETTQLKLRKKRTSSITSTESTDQFLFSPPERTAQHPVDKGAISDVPKYVFSPPQTRAKNVPSDQHRRNIKPFMPMPRDDVEEECAEQTGSKPSQQDNYIGVTVNRVKSRFMTKFVIPKSRSKSSGD